LPDIGPISHLQTALMSRRHHRKLPRVARLVAGEVIRRA
jgi:hypothetical protein